MQKLTELVKNFRKALDEKRRLTLMERDAEQLLASAAEEGIESAAAQEKVSRARVMQDLVKLRRKHLGGSPTAAAPLRAELIAVGRQWNDQVKTAKGKIEEDFLAAIRPFFGGNERTLRRFHKAAIPQIPALQVFAKAQFHAPSSTSADEVDWAAESDNLMARIRRYSSLVGK